MEAGGECQSPGCSCAAVPCRSTGRLLGSDRIFRKGMVGDKKSLEERADRSNLLCVKMTIHLNDFYVNKRRLSRNRAAAALTCNMAAIHLQL